VPGAYCRLLIRRPHGAWGAQRPLAIPGPAQATACSAVGLADLLDQAPAQHEQVTKHGVDRVNRGGARPPGGCLVGRGAPVGPLHQGHVEDAGTVPQVSRGMSHDASPERAPRPAHQCLAKGSTVAGGHARKSTRVSDTCKTRRGHGFAPCLPCPLECKYDTHCPALQAGEIRPWRLRACLAPSRPVTNRDPISGLAAADPGSLRNLAARRLPCGGKVPSLACGWLGCGGWMRGRGWR
jgi:hypothetical protein